MDGVKSTVSQKEVEDLLFNREIGWKEIIYDLINTEQLDPWDIDIGRLAEGFLLRIQQYEETDFFISSKVLLAAALLLRIKSELLLSRYMKSIDSILFGEKEEKKPKEMERIELEEEIPELVLRSPVPRFRKVTLNELIESLNKAIITENRRIKKAIVDNNALRESGISLPKRKYSIINKMKGIHEKIRGYFDSNKEEKKVPYTEIVGKEKEERALSFFPVIQLENNGEVWLEQEKHFDESTFGLKKYFLKKTQTLMQT
jgi:segregation and condensation protein A